VFRPHHLVFPKYKSLQKRYHGRASSIVPSDTRCRPRTQIVESAAAPPVCAPTRLLDYEFGVGAFIGTGNRLGAPSTVGDVGDPLSLYLVNDRSARHIQARENQPLKPGEELRDFHFAVRGDGGGTGAVPAAAEATPVGRSRAAAARVGRHIRNVTADGSRAGGGAGEPPQLRRLDVLTFRLGCGAPYLEFPGGERRRFLEDVDEVILKGWCGGELRRQIAAGECRGKVLPALS
jgi:fumarylacetoacetase